MSEETSIQVNFARPIPVFPLDTAMNRKELDKSAQRRCLARGLRLLHRGDYWEAHESWEKLWRSLPPKSSAGLATKALIQLAAICYKPEQAACGRDESGMQRGMQRLLRTSQQHLADSFQGSAPSPDWSRTCLRQLLGELHSTLDRWCAQASLAAVRNEIRGLTMDFDPRIRDSNH